ncbi:superoxide dismutase [Cu-Zn] isoform X2 [Megalopta genalis]
MNRLMLLLVTITAVSAGKMYCGIVKLAAENPKQADVTGDITFIQDVDNSTVHIIGTINGLTPGKHGFHVHEKGDMRQGCISAGSHYNPTQQSHGGPTASERHVGDLGNIEADPHGITNIDIYDNIITLNGRHSVIGRSVVVHAGEDDLGNGHESDSLTTGHSGGRVACGIIGILQTP